MLLAFPRVIRFKLGPNVVEDAVYPSPLVDVHGKPLFESGMKYVLHFEKEQMALGWKRQRRTSIASIGIL